MGRILASVLATLALIAVLGFVAIWFGFVPARADTPPFPGEAWAAHHALDATVAREAPQPPYPYGPVTDATLIAGAKLYREQCADCHGSGVGDASTMARGMYVSPPQFGRHGVADDATGATYWKIEHGIRFTGMPAFAGILTEEQIWQIAYFLKQDPATLPPEAAQQWSAPHGN